MYKPRTHSVQKQRQGGKLCSRGGGGEGIHLRAGYITNKQVSKGVKKRDTSFPGPQLIESAPHVIVILTLTQTFGVTGSSPRVPMPYHLLVLL